MTESFTPPATLPRRRSRAGIAYIAGGSGAAPLLFIHGVGLSADCWQAQMDAFSPQWRVLALDLPGHGESAPFPQQSPQMSDFAAKIADFIENEVGEAVTLVGHSLGALVALHTAARAPQWVRAAALLSGVYARDAAAQQAVAQRARTLQGMDSAARAALIDATLVRWFGASPSAAVQRTAAACRHWLQHTPPPAYAAAYRVFAAAGAEAAPLRDLAQPLLYITGDGDANSTAEMTHALAAQSPNAQAAVLAGHAHMLQLTAAAQLNALLRQWLDAQPRQSAA